MGQADISPWEPAFDGLGTELTETTPPSDAGGTWYMALSTFARHSFARLFVCPDDTELSIRLETVLGPPDGTDKLAETLRQHLHNVTDSPWSLTTEPTRWALSTTLSDDNTSIDRLRRLVLEVLEIAEHFESIGSADKWFDILDANSDRGGQHSDDDASSGGDPPFETIGNGTDSEDERTGSDSQQRRSDATSEENATLLATAATRLDDHLVAALAFEEVLSNRQLEALADGLEHHLHTKFEVQARRIDDVDRPELRMPASARTTLYLDIDPGRYDDGLSSLKRNVQGFFDTLEKFSSFGVDVFEYLGVGETIFDDQEPTPPASTDSERQLSFRPSATTQPRNSASATSSDDDDGVVLALQSSDTTSGGGRLKAKNFTDPRLQRDDAKTSLVDVVLRHPGYSDERIGQVLSILLSIEYHNAIDIADSAPCVIAWAVGRKRALRFQDVIENAGGKVLLVEPGTFGED